MKQYCRYCANMVCGDANYCSWLKQTLSDNQIKNLNRCKGFEFCEIDALGENLKPYKPREEKQILAEQITFAKEGEGE